jgi:hypothetical protein
MKDARSNHTAERADAVVWCLVSDVCCLLLGWLLELDGVQMLAKLLVHAEHVDLGLLENRVQFGIAHD